EERLRSPAIALRRRKENVTSPGTSSRGLLPGRTPSRARVPFSRRPDRRSRCAPPLPRGRTSRISAALRCSAPPIPCRLHPGFCLPSHTSCRFTVCLYGPARAVSCGICPAVFSETPRELSCFGEIVLAELLVVELRVQAAAGEKLGMPPHVHHPSRFQDDDLIGPQHRRQPMRDHDGRAVAQQPVQRVLNPPLRA